MRKHPDEEECRRLSATIGRAARMVRERKKLTQADISERIGRNSEFYARIERGHCLPSIKTLARIATALGVEADILLGRKSAKRSTRTQVETQDDANTDRPELRRLRRLLRQARPETVRFVTSMLDEFDRYDRAYRD